MAYDPQKHHRRSIRLKGYDYIQAGAYFITIWPFLHIPRFSRMLPFTPILIAPGAVSFTVSLLT